MKTVKAVLSLTGAAVIVTFGIQDAMAVRCSGYITVKGEPSVEIIKKADGSVVSFIMSHRIRNVKEPANDPSDGAHGTCVGLWTLAPDGKSGSGAGHCYYVDREGDSWAVSWEGDNTGGTWDREWGMGKYKDGTGTGTWEPSSPRYSDGFRLTPWKGDCSYAK